MSTEKHSLLFAWSRSQAGAVHHLNSNTQQHTNQHGKKATKIVSLNNLEFR